MLVDGAPRPTLGETDRLRGGLRAPIVEGSSVVALASAVLCAVLPVSTFPAEGFSRPVGPQSLTLAGPRGARAPLGAEGSSRTFIGVGPKLGLP